LPVVDQLWPIAQKIISKSVKLATSLLLLFGTENDSLSPFCKEFTTVQDLLQTYIEYCPKTYSYDGQGGSIDVEPNYDVNNWEGNVAESLSNNESANVIPHFEHFTTDLLSAAVLPYEESINNDGEIIVFDGKQSRQAVDQQNKRQTQAQITLLNTFTELTKCNKIEDLFDSVISSQCSN
jgi:hypothetical protein